MLGIIDVGGGLRDIYGAGIFDYCIEQSISFDYYIGVSAGSANIAAFLTQQYGRNYRFYTEFAFRKEYMSLGNFVKHGSYVDLDYVYSELCKTGGEFPLDYAKLAAAPGVFKIVAGDAKTGRPVYFDKEYDIALDQYDVLKASSCLPLLCKPYPIGNRLYYDGGIVDPIPFRKAFADGCNRVVIILTRPVDVPRVQSKRDLTASIFLKNKYPAMSKALKERYLVYNNALAEAQKYVAEGRVLILAPDDLCGLKTLTKDREKLDKLYRKGKKDAVAIKPWL